MGKGSDPPTVSALQPGMQLGGFQLLTMIAQGGMGTVWLARPTTGPPTYVALKSILPTHGENERFFQMFLDEAGIASRIQHDNVVRVLRWGEDGGCLYLAMEYLEGDSLRKLARGLAKVRPGQPFPMAVALRLAADTCAGLHAAHELRDEEGRPLDVVHRDVSPQNVIVGLDGRAKLIDFGVAKARYRLASETTAGTLKGKVEYMAPEQVKGGVVDRRADIYAVGAMTYELLAGHPVHEHGEDQQIRALHALITGEPHKPLPDHVPSAVRAVIECALSREPSARFASCAEMKVALEQAMAQAGLAAAAPAIGALVDATSGERIRKRRATADTAARALEGGRAVTPASLSQIRSSASASGASGAIAAIAAADASGGYAAFDPSGAAALDPSGAFPAPTSAGSYSGQYPAPTPSGAHPAPVPTSPWPSAPRPLPPPYGGYGGTDGAMVAPPPRKGSGLKWAVAVIAMFGVLATVGVAVGVTMMKRVDPPPVVIGGGGDGKFSAPPGSGAPTTQTSGQASAGTAPSANVVASAPATGVPATASATPSTSAAPSAKPKIPVGAPPSAPPSGKGTAKPPSTKGGDDYGF